MPLLADVGLLRYEIMEMQMDVWCFHERQLLLVVVG